MRIRLIASDEQRAYDTQLGRFTDRETIPCFRCGVCCRRWQPLVNRAEADRVAGFLGISMAALLAEFARPYPLEEDVYQLNAVDGGCVFLRSENGLASCAVHEARPQACRDWDASLQRSECLDGLKTMAGHADLAVNLPLFGSEADAEAFRRALRGER